MRLAQRRAELLGCERGWGVVMRVTKLPVITFTGRSESQLPRLSCFSVADGTYARTNAFPKLTLSRSANQLDWVFIASSHRSHAFTLAVAGSNNHFLCSIDVCSEAVADPSWPKTTNQQKLIERIIRCTVYLFLAHKTITTSRLLVRFYAAKAGRSGRKDNVSVWSKILTQAPKGLLLNRV